LNPALSVWLDLCRVLAALAVFVGHSVVLEVAPAALGRQWHRSADDAVTAFFVISGLVIAYTTHAKQGSARDYALARLSRVYSVALPTVLFAFVIDHIGMRWNVAEYVPDWQYPRAWLYMPFYWVFLGETWFGATQPFTMAPYWSLAYEAWYYAMFGCVVFARGRWRWGLVAAVVLVMGPRIWLLMPVWCLGVALYRRLPSLQVRAPVAWLLMAGAVLAYAAYITAGWQRATDEASLQMYTWFGTVLPVPFFKGSTVHALSDYVMAVIFAVFAIGCASCRVDFGPATGRWIKTAASYTFTFYMIHFTLLTLCRALGYIALPWFGYGLALMSMLATSWALAQIGEQRRGWYRRLFDAILPGRVTP
jgi:peptidoglycan/LPS O-acetylase OafA/YrhL